MTALTALDVQVTQSEQKPDLNRFIATLGGLSKALLDVDRAATPGRVPRPRWLVDDLRHEGEHFHVQLTAAPVNKRDMESLLRPVTALVSGIRELREQPELPPFYSETTIDRLIVVAKPREGIQEVALAPVNGQVGPYEALDERVLDNARSAVKEAERSIGSITGTLTGLKTTKQGLRIAIHDPVARRTINGTSTLSLAEELRLSWNHRCILRGRIARNLVGQALRISVTNVERLPDDREERNITRQLLGADPNWTGGLTVDEYMREVRRHG